MRSRLIGRRSAFEIRVSRSPASKAAALRNTRSCPRARSSPFAAAAEHAEIAGHNLEAGALLPLFILPLARLNSSLDVNQRALLQILLGDFRLLAPYNNLVPLGALLALAVAVLVSLVGRDRKIGHRLAATGKSRLGISSQPPDQNH